MVNIFKANGHLTEFKKSKIEKTVIKAGGSRKFAKQIADKVAKKVHRGTKTKDILKLTLKLLKEQPGVALRYDLKRAIMELGPHGFTFEEYFSQILQNYNYKTKVGFIIKGKATHHEVDILASHNNDKRKEMIECKYHNRVGKHTDSKVAMYTYARYLDLKNNPKNKITHGWLVTNTKCTHHAVEYAKGVGLKITTWDYASKGEKNLQELIKTKGVYPITILPSIEGEIKDKLATAKIVLAKDIILYDLKELKGKTGLKQEQVKRILTEAKEVFSNGE